MRYFILFYFFSLANGVLAVSDTLLFKAQLSAYANYNPNNTMDLSTGLRFVPQANYELHFERQHMLDFELSANAFGNLDVQLLDSVNTHGDIKPYRLWGRYSTEQLEVRVGLQKIDFGQAMMLRPLMWFDSVDPRDPLGITDGVYGALMRYYFLENTNVWLWGLYGNKGTKGLELASTAANSVELGGRIQSSLLAGEVALSYHHRQMDGSALQPAITHAVSENRYGFDARWDVLVGAYVEAAWVNNSSDLGPLTNQEFMTLGLDYTFALGGGLYTAMEHMWMGSGETAFLFDQSAVLTALQLSYPLGMFDNIGTIFYYDWMNEHLYSFANWYRQYDRMTFYLMGYWNPKNASFILPGQEGMGNFMSGRGVQAMVVFTF